MRCLIYCLTFLCVSLSHDLFAVEIEYIDSSVGVSPRIYRVQLGASLEKSEVANKVPQIETKYGPV